MQTEQLSYAIVSPCSMRKSRTGGIIARLISRTGLDLVAARMFAPGKELVERYAETIVTETDPRHRATQELIRQYVLQNFTGEKSGQRARALFLVLRGPDAVEKVHRAVGHIVHERTSGETIRDTFGDYIADESGKVSYFEPAVLAAFDPQAVERDLKLWAQFSDSDGGILDTAINYPDKTGVEKTLVLIKPDNFKFPNIRPGGVIEVFSRSGLYIVGFKVHRMSVAEAEEFYGPVLPVLEEKLGPESGRSNWESIVEFMAGKKPSDCPANQRTEPGTEKSIGSFTKAWTRFARSARCWGRPIRRRRPPAQSAKSSGRRLWLMPLMPPIRWTTQSGKWASSESTKTTSNL